MAQPHNMALGTYSWCTCVHAHAAYLLGHDPRSSEAQRRCTYLLFTLFSEN